VEPRSDDDAPARTATSPVARLTALVHTAWPIRVVWAVQPLLLGPALGAALDEASRGVQVVASVGAWLAWLAVLVATLVPTTVSLTALRLAAPGAAVAAVVAAVVVGVEPSTMVGLAAALAAAFAGLAPETAEVFVDGSSYGPETRMPLKVPVALLAGPVEVAWLAAVGGTCTGPLLLADRRWVLGGLALAAGVPLAWWGVRSLHTLSRRWLVFVPAGMVIHDPLALVDPILLRRGSVRSFGPAPADTDAVDLTVGAAGLALEARLDDPVSLLPVTSRRTLTELKEVRAVLVTPSRPGRVLAEARRRQFG
jgi:hypothetical protein